MLRRALLLLPLCMTAQAQTVQLSGVLGGTQALIQIDGGTPRALSAGQMVQGVRIVRVDGHSAVVQVQDGAPHTLRLGDGPLQLRPTVPNTTPGRARIVLWADALGHFTERGSINGQPVTFMVDTGASIVSMGSQDAKRLKLPYEREGQPITLRTANGDAPGWRVRLNSVRLGALEVRDLDAVVTSRPGMPYILLGNNFLEHVRMTRQGREMVLQQR